MENVNRWYFTKDQLANTPSRKCGIDANKELSYRQQAANFIQDMGQRLQVSQLCINTAIVYMHRFYFFHSFSEVHRNSLSVAALFLAAKVEEQPRKLEHVIKVAHVCLHKDSPPLDVRTEAYSEKQFEVVAHENILLQTLGFVLAIEHPHTYVVKVCQLVKASKDLAQTSYFMATTSLHMTTMCLQYRPTVVACVCIHLACKWSSWKIEPCSEGKEWYYYVDKSVTLELLETLTQEFIAILETSPHRFKRKFIAQKDGGYPGAKSLLDESSSLGKLQSLSSENKIGLAKKDTSSPGPSTSLSFQFCSDVEERTSVKVEASEKPAVPAMQSSPSKKVKVEPVHSISLASYREKREKERLENKTLPVESTHQPGISKPQHAFNEHEKVLPKTVAKPVEHSSHIAKEKGNKISAAKELQVHPTSVNKINHQLLKTGSEFAHVKENKSNVNLVKSSNVSNDPVVVLKRVDMKAECKDSVPDSEVQTSSLQHFHTDNLPISLDHKYDINENSSDSKEGLISVIKVETPQIVKTKHQKHKVNSVHNSHSNIQMLPHKQSPSKDIKTNGSKESGDIDKRRQTIVENNIGSSRSSDGSSTTSKHDGSSSKHEKREKHRNKHSAHSSKDKFVNNHSEHSTPGIKVKIRKDIICLPESSQKSQPVVKSEGQKKSIKIKISKPSLQEPAKAMKGNNPSPIKLVITKDKSGSGSYSTSHKNDHESRKRVHSPASQEANSKNCYEPSSKYVKVDHNYKAHHATDGPSIVIKQSKSVRHSAQRSNVELHHSTNDISAGRLQHSVNDSTVYNNVDVGGFGGQPYYQYYPYQVAPPPPPPPPPPSLMLRGHGPSLGKTNSNPPLPPPLPPQPPPPPPE